jgi:hypothetical protein
MAFLVVLVTRHGRVRQPSGALDRLIDALTNRDFSVLVVLCALVGKLGWFLWALAIGVNLFWQSCSLGLTFSLLRRRRELVWISLGLLVLLRYYGRRSPRASSSG